MSRRHFTWMSCGVVLACLGVMQSGRAQSSGSASGGFMPLNIVGSPNALSADGTVVVGQYLPAGAADVHPFRWTEAGGQVDLGLLAGFGGGGATSASADGSVIVGFAGQFYQMPPPWRWTTQTGMVALAPMPAGFFTGQANDVSADGTVVVGTMSGATLPSGVGFFEPFRWTAANGIVPLGNLGGPQTTGAAVSADGAVVVGFTNFGNFHVEAFRWTAQTGMVGLGTVPGFSNSVAYDTSADGTVVVGTTDAFFEEAPAFRWTAQDGMVSLGDFPGGRFESSARAVSADGSVVVGFGHDGNPVGQFGDMSVFIWDSVHGMRALRDVLLEQGTDVSGWRLSYPFGMSADRRVIGGLGINPSGAVQSWLARLAETTSCTPPVLSSVAATPSVLWPPNHKMVPISVAVEATAACGPPVCTIESIASDGPSSEGDVVITGDLTALLRAEKSSSFMGRTYTITVQCHDAVGNGATQATTVRVPHDQRR